MTRLPALLEAWNSDRFFETVKAALEGLGPGALPLSGCTASGGLVDGSGCRAMVLGAQEEPGLLRVRVGVFFTEIVINCGCGDEPMEQQAYCELEVTIDRETGDTLFRPCPR